MHDAERTFMEALKTRLRSLSCTVFCERNYTKQLARGYYWVVSVSHTPYTRWSGSFLTKLEVERFLRHVLEEVSNA